MKIKVMEQTLPEGVYRVKLVSAEKTPANSQGTLRFVFVVSEGPYQGRQLARLTGGTPSPGNACGRMIESLLGRPLVIDEEIDVNPFLDQEYLATVSSREDGWSRIERIQKPT